MKPRQISRRTVLRGLGLLVPLPWLESMGNAAPATKAKRLAVFYVPNGVSLPPESSPAHKQWSWFPLGEGRNYEFTETLASLQPHRQRLTILGGLSHPRSREILGHAAGDTFLTGGDVSGEYRNSISFDQVAARHMGRATRHPSLVLSCDGGIGYKTRVSTLSFGPGGTPIPSESMPRQIFERYFQTGGTEAEAAARRRLGERQKVVDVVKGDSSDLKRQLGKNDKERLDEYLGVLSEIEDRIERAESWIGKPFKVGDIRKLNLDAKQINPEEYIRTMCDLIVLGFQTDTTRLVTYMVAREDGMGWGDQFPALALGIKDGHHNLSHDRSLGAFERWARYDQFLAKQFAYFLKRMTETQDEEGSLLDSTLVLYGSACSTTHNARNYPLILAGAERLGLRHGRYRVYGDGVPLANLFVAMLGALGVKTPQFADSTGATHDIFSA
ncbi:MAG: DUF1552 domain-containing protein [Deltaproteobacteria bacterium]|nr:DUF1552 domain-containing protein [Deltaproteobacteria bacterium]